MVSIIWGQEKTRGGSMTPRESVQCALNHELRDRTPMDLGIGVSTLILDADRRLSQHLEIQYPEGHIAAFKVAISTAEEILRALRVASR
jgi:hypothetical protein